MTDLDTTWHDKHLGLQLQAMKWPVPATDWALTPEGLLAVGILLIGLVVSIAALYGLYGLLVLRGLAKELPWERDRKLFGDVEAVGPTRATPQ